MKISEVFNLAMSLLPTNTSEDDSLEQYIVGWVNLTLQEMLEAENSLRRFYGEEPLNKAPVLEDIEDEIDYHDALVRYALVYNIASLCCKDDDDTYWANDYRNRYVVAVQEALKMNQGNVIDVYWGES